MIKDKIKIINVEIDNITIRELLILLKKGGKVYTPNVDHILKLAKDFKFQEAYKYSTYVVCDSQIIKTASKLLGTPIVEKISGSDLFPAFYNYYKNDLEITIFLLGGKPGIAELAAFNINKKVGRKIIVGTYSPKYSYNCDLEEQKENIKIIEEINKSRATVLAVGLGAPKQEIWIDKYSSHLNRVNLFSFLMES